MDAEFVGALRRDGAVEVFEDFARELHACYGAHVVRGVVGEAPFVLVGERAELEESGVGQGGGVGDGGVVDFSYVDDVVDFLNVLVLWVS